MNGAEGLIRTAVSSGVDVCFANPGTTEMQLVAALDAAPGMRAVLGLFEGVCTGAADGYARMTGRPALTLLHLGPGFANGIANLHNARRAHTPVVNLIGDHASWHLAADAPLTSDIASLARPVSGWVRKCATASDLPADGADAIAAALEPPGQVATLIVPQDCAWDRCPGPAAPAKPRARNGVPEPRVEAAAGALESGAPSALYLGGSALRAPALQAAARVAAATGCALIHETFAARVERGAGLPTAERLPYFPEQGAERLRPIANLVLAGAHEPVAFFGYPDHPSRLAAVGTRVQLLADDAEDVVGALETLAQRVRAPARAPIATPERVGLPSGPLTAGALGQALAALQPDGAIVVDEGATSGLAYYAHAAGAPPHDYLGLTGGAIGQGLPTAVGAAVACPDRKVIAFQADGSGMYTLQALWTCAREVLDVVVVIAANRAYRILQVELARAGIAEPGARARALTDLSHPVLDWVALARGMGVPGVRADTAEDFIAAFRRALAEPGPQLIEAVLA
ncbi:MAG: acetolactate synthase large subunit [Deltaproteobacteria bacterium]|nr:MAG: acetolactate synthase large subunit [Deltaproteobacteria bacterium]